MQFIYYINLYLHLINSISSERLNFFREAEAASLTLKGEGAVPEGCFTVTKTIFSDSYFVEREQLVCFRSFLKSSGSHFV